jgi:hypothetical protein
VCNKVLKREREFRKLLNVDYPDIRLIITTNFHCPRCNRNLAYYKGKDTTKPLRINPIKNDGNGIFDYEKVIDCPYCNKKHSLIEFKEENSQYTRIEEFDGEEYKVTEFVKRWFCPSCEYLSIIGSYNNDMYGFDYDDF